ncbi:hypothetical protein Ancab_001874 [Ancistrocladus abbreviatus]
MPIPPHLRANYHSVAIRLGKIGQEWPSLFHSAYDRLTRPLFGLCFRWEKVFPTVGKKTKEPTIVVKFPLVHHYPFIFTANFLLHDHWPSTHSWHHFRLFIAAILFPSSFFL